MSTIRESLKRADILKLNEEELPAITQLLGYQMAGEEVLCRRQKLLTTAFEN